MSKPMIGRVIADRYEILETLGEGGMGAVYKAKQLALDRVVALKVIRPELMGQGSNVQRFLREAAAAAKMTHSNIVRVFDFGHEEDLTLWLAMEYLEGRSLYHLLRDEGAQHPARAVHIAEQVAEALHDAHIVGVIHRDIKPGNIMLVQQGDDPDHVKVVDFGLARSVEPGEDGRLTMAGIVMGSPAYMSPEQLQQHDLDGRSDLFALGIVMYELIAGHLPHPHDSAQKLMQANVSKPPPRFAELDPPLDVPADVENIVLQLLQKNPDDRPESAAAAAKVLHRLARKMGGTLMLRMAQGDPSGESAELPELPPAAPPPQPTGLPPMYLAGIVMIVLIVAAVSFTMGTAM